MTGKLVGIAKQVFKLLLVELLVPGGTLVVLVLLLSGKSTPAIPEKVAHSLPFLKGWGRV